MISKTTKALAVGFLALGLIVTPAASPAHAQTSTSTASLQAQIAALLAQVAALQAQLGVSAGASFTRDLTIGASGADVTRLQQFLIARGHGIPAGATGYFGMQTRAALAAFQSAQGISPAAGYFGPITRARVNAMIGGTPSPSPSPTPTPDDDGDLEGGAGSVDSYEVIASLNNEEVGEDEEDSEVAGLEIEVDEGSDIELTAVRLVFDEGTGTDSDFEDYAAEVSLWLDGEEVARVDADEFNDDNDWTATISLDEGAIIRRGETGELTVAVSGAANIDSSDFDDEWSVDFRQIRFRDADGATVSEDPNTGARTFSFERFASAADVELRITEGDDEINDARTIDVDATDDTDDVEVLAFDIEVEGDSDIEVNSLPIEFTVTGAAHLDDIAANVRLIMDGEEVGDENVPTDEETVVFDDLDIVLEAGETHEFIVEVDLLSLADALDEGDTLSATIGETETDSASFDAEDESGDELVDADITGSATGGPHAFFDAGITVTFVSATETVATSDGTDNDTGTFQLKYRVASEDDTIYVSDTAAATTATDVTAATITGAGILYRVDEAGTATTADVSSVVSWSRVTGTPTDSTNGVRIDGGEEAEFTLTVVRTNSGDADDDGLYRMMLKAIGWNTNDSTTWNVFDFDLDDFRTDPIFLN